MNYASAAKSIVEILGEPAVRDLLQLLESNDAIRADAFRQCHERGRHEPLLNALTDLEADSVMRGWLVERLRIALDAQAF
jgi:hypothetical protein